MKTHSKRTGKIILAVLAFILVGSGLFFYLAVEEAKKILYDEDRFRSMSCEDMRLELTTISKDDPNYSWMAQAINDKVDCN
jgi:hypothetical protein